MGRGIGKSIRHYTLALDLDLSGCILAITCCKFNALHFAMQFSVLLMYSVKIYVYVVCKNMDMEDGGASMIQFGYLFNFQLLVHLFRLFIFFVHFTSLKLNYLS